VKKKKKYKNSSKIDNEGTLGGPDDKNSMFVWDTVKLKSRRKEARDSAKQAEKLKAEARSAEVIRKSPKKKKATISVAKSAARKVLTSVASFSMPKRKENKELKEAKLKKEVVVESVNEIKDSRVPEVDETSSQSTSDEAMSSDKYFNKSFGAVSLDNIVVQPRRRSSQSQSQEPEPVAPPTRPPPPKKPKRKL
jgi:hypothetical protein